MRGAVAPCGFQSEEDVAVAVDAQPLVGDRRARDVAAQLLDTLAIIGIATHASVQTEALGIGAPHVTRAMRLAQITASCNAAHKHEHLAPRARPHGDAVRAGGRLQRRKHVVRIRAVRARQVDNAFFFDQMAQARQ